jgi:hypothetical protein
MSKEFNTIGTNTDPLSVQLYFDENNSIKWRIIFKDTNQIFSTEYTQPNGQMNQMNQINQINYPQVENQQVPEHPITNLFSNIFIISPKYKYQFKYTDIQLELDDLEVVTHEIEYNSFDHLKFNKLTAQVHDKPTAWKHYLKSIRNSTQVNLDLDSIELSQINSLIKIINSSIESGSKECLIIFGDFSTNSTNITWFKKNKDKFEISKGKILLLWYTTADLTQPAEKKIIPANNFTQLKSFIIKSQLYSDFLKKLNEKKITWESCLYQLIEENQFESYQIVPQLFFN